MKPSSVTLKNGNPCLHIGGEEFPACAYMTYFEERNDYAAFAEKGFRIFSVTVSFANQPINAASGFNPTTCGVFDRKGEPDFSGVDETIRKILRCCPDACIFPRIYVCMPQWWIEENPTEIAPVPHGKYREALYSKKFCADAAEMLKSLIRHFREFADSDHIFGYQISGGNTQEWGYLDCNGSFCENTLPCFNAWRKKQDPAAQPLTALPDLPDLIRTPDLLTDPLVLDYLRFCNDTMADTVRFLCRAAKEAAEYQQIVGVFYGYTAEVANPLWGTHSLYRLLDAPEIDFFSSPNSYNGQRSLGAEWGDMMPVDSIKLHGKMCFMECDIRTFLSRSPGSSRQGSDPLNFYTDKVWEGPPTEVQSVWAVRRSLARQLTHTHGLWWFDMFGHWYASPGLMEEMGRSLRLYQETLDQPRCSFPPQAALMLDEGAFTRMGVQHPACSSAYQIRDSLAKSGVPHSVFLTSDFDRIHWETSSFRALVFGTLCTDAFRAHAEAVLQQHGIRSLWVTPEKPGFPPRELADFFAEAGAFFFCQSGDIFYQGNGYAAIHAVTAGAKQLCTPRPVRWLDVTTVEETVTDRLCLDLQQFEARLFRLSLPEQD